MRASTRLKHTEGDTVDKIRPEDLRRNAAAVALLAYVLAEQVRADHPNGLVPSS